MPYIGNLGMHYCVRFSQLQSHIHTKHTGASYTLVASSYNGTIVIYLSLLFLIGLIWDHMLIVFSTTVLCIASPGICLIGECTWLYVTWS